MLVRHVVLASSTAWICLDALWMSVCQHAQLLKHLQSAGACSLQAEDSLQELPEDRYVMGVLLRRFTCFTYIWVALELKANTYSALPFSQRSHCVLLTLSLPCNCKT